MTMKKTLWTVVFVIIMVLALAGCGRGAQPNGGVKDIVFTVPEYWTLEESIPSVDSIYTNPDSPYKLSIYTFTEEDLATMREEYEEYKSMTMQEYFEQTAKLPEEVIGKNGMEMAMFR